MDKSTVDKLKNFLEENKGLVDENKWDYLFVEWVYTYSNDEEERALSELLDHVRVDYISYCWRIVGYMYSARNDLTKVNIPSNIKEIGYSSFGWCGNLKEVIINEGTVKIDSNAFTWCHSLKYVTLPDSVTSMEPDVFSGCDISKLIVRCHAGSYAEDYCKKHFIKCEII